MKRLVAERFSHKKVHLGEGPLWIEETKRLYFVDIEGHAVHAYDAKGENHKVQTFQDRIGFIAPLLQGGFILGMGHGLYEWQDDRITMIGSPLEVALNTRINDGKVDPYGRLVFGTLDLNFNRPIGALYRWDTNLETLRQGVTISNGLCFYNEMMYYIDTVTKAIDVYHYTKKEMTFIRSIDLSHQPGSPDGMTVDQEGNLWVAMWGGGKVLGLDPASNLVHTEIIVAAEHVTCPVFGGEDLKTLFITTAEGSQEGSGYVYKITMPIGGFLPYRML